MHVKRRMIGILILAVLFAGLTIWIALEGLDELLFWIIAVLFVGLLALGVWLILDDK